MKKKTWLTEATLSGAVLTKLMLIATWVAALFFDYEVDNAMSVIYAAVTFSGGTAAAAFTRKTMTERAQAQGENGSDFAPAINAQAADKQALNNLNRAVEQITGRERPSND